MASHPGCLCFVMMGIVAHVALAADTEVLRPGRVGRPTAGDPSAGQAVESGRVPSFVRHTLPRPERKTQTAKRPTPQSWNDHIAGYFSFGALGYRLFPLALLAKSEHALFGAPQRTELPPILISAQFSRELVERFFQRAIERDDVVDDLILGTKIDGQSHLTGNVRLALVPSENEIRFDIIFTGICRSKTRGVNDVIVLQNTAETRFEAHKPLVWNSAGITTGPAVATAETRSRTNQINSTLPGVIGWVATQVAQGRANETRAQADAISSQHSAARIQRGLDARVDHLLAWATLISHYLPASSFLRRSTRIELSTTPECVGLAVVRRGVAGTAAPMKMPTIPDDCDLAIEIHRGVLRRMAREPVALMIGGLVMDQILVTERPDVVERQDFTTSSPRHPAWQVARSPDRQWLTVRHARVTLPADVGPAREDSPVAASLGAPVVSASMRGAAVQGPARRGAARRERTPAGRTAP